MSKQSGRSARPGRALSLFLHRFLPLLLLLIGFAPHAAQADAFLPAIGGGGGSQFKTQCAAGQNLAGFELRTADDVDGIRPVCVIGSGLKSADLVSDPAAYPWTGGPGAQIQRLLCPVSTPIVIGIDVAAEGRDSIIVNNIHLYCGHAVTSQSAAALPSAIFDAPGYVASPGVLGLTVGGDPAYVRNGSQRCPAGQVAIGVHGRSGIWLDAMGLICAPPRLPVPPIGLGRVKSPPGTTPTPPRSICDSAANARARNSPAAAGLEAQCRAQRAAQPPVALGKVPNTPSSAAPASICDAAASARARNSPAAPGLEAQCRARGGPAPVADPVAATDELAARGEAIANSDSRLTALRELQPESLRRGFDIGIAATEGHTAWGPGKQRLLDSLGPEDREGFRIAAFFAMDRNRNSELAAVGFAISEADPEVAAARSGESDPRYWLGFDIASGLFGDPAQGAKGNTATGPGSLGIRDALSAEAQSGFNASVNLHLARQY